MKYPDGNLALCARPGKACLDGRRLGDGKVARVTSLLVFAMALLAAVTAGAAAQPEAREMRIIAHRGAHTEAPPNTIASLRRAVELGADYVELDLRTTSDGKIIDMHDDEVDTTTNGKGLVALMTFAQIRKLDAGVRAQPKFRGERVPLFAEELALAKDRVKLYLDLKAVEPAQVLRLLRQFDMVQDAVCCGRMDQLLALQAAEPRILVMPRLAHAEDMERLVERLHPRFVQASGDSIDEAAVKAAHAYGTRCFLDVHGAGDDEQYLLTCLRAGVDGIQTDNPRLAIEVFRRAGVERPPLPPPARTWPARGERMDSGRTKLIAHRGVMKLAPQNSLEAAALAIQMGFDYIEADVRETADGLLANIHNRTVDETTNGHGAVKDYRYADLRKLDAGSWFSPKFKGVYIPLLGEVLAMAKGRCGLYLDWKDADPEPVVQLLQDFDMTREVLVHADPEMCLAIRALDPTVVLMPGADGVGGVRQVYEQVHPQAVEIRWSSFSEEAVRVCHALGMLAMTSHANGRGDDDAGIRRGAQARLDGFETDEPKLALQVLRELQPK